MYGSKSFVIILLVALALTIIVPAVSGISSLQLAKADKSGHNGQAESNNCSPPAVCNVRGGTGGVGNVANLGISRNGNGGNGGRTDCSEAGECFAPGELGGSDYGIVIISKQFEKNWPQQDLQALITKQVNRNKKIILPIWHDISTEEIQRYYPMLADTVAANSAEGIENIAKRLNGVIRGTRTVYDFSSEAKLKNDVSSLIKSIEETEEELVLVTLTKIYFITKGYRNVFIYLWPFFESLSSTAKEREKLDQIIVFLKDQKLVLSKALGTISITHQGIKKIEELLEDSSKKEFLPSISEVEKSNVLEIQKLRHDVLKQAYDLSNQKGTIVNLFEIGKLLGIEKEKLERIYFYLEDEGLIDFYALGGSFFITDKGKELIETRNSNRIF